MDMPTMRVYCPYASRGYGSHSLMVDVGPIRVWFSYDTPVAFQVDGHERVVRKNSWGPTTGKHLNAIDGGGFAKKSRVESEVFEKLWKEQVEPILKATKVKVPRRRAAVTA